MNGAIALSRTESLALENFIEHVKLRGTLTPNPTPAELRVIELRAIGKSQKEIASELNVAISTVETQMSTIYRRMGWNSVVPLIHYALHYGLVDNMFRSAKRDKLTKFFETNLGQKFSAQYLRDIFGESVATRISAINLDDEAKVLILERFEQQQIFYSALEK